MRVPIAALLFTATLFSPAARAEKFTFLDLQMWMNHKLADEFSDDGRTGNTLDSLPKGKQKFADVEFRIGKGIVMLGSTVRTDKPDKVTQLGVGNKFRKMHILHAAQYGGGPNKPGAPWYVEDGTRLGEYKIHYEDDTVETIPIVYGEDVRDWWFREDEKGVSRGKVAWTGVNDLAPRYACGLRLYLTTWESPHPEKRVLTLDYLSRKKDTVGAPFCVAISVEN